MTTQTIEKMRQMRLYQMASIHHQRKSENLHQDYSVDEYTSLLVDQEWEERQNRKIDRLVKNAKFKIFANFSDIDFSTKRNLDKDKMNRILSLEFLKKKLNIIFSGPSGVGKSYLAQAIGHQACNHGFKTFYYQSARLLAILKFAKLDGTYLKHLARLSKMALLILDDFGLHNLDNTEREILMDLIEDRHELASTIIATQIPVSKWYEVIGESTIADAIMDRLVHSAYILDLQGESKRKEKKPKF